MSAMNALESEFKKNFMMDDLMSLQKIFVSNSLSFVDCSPHGI